MASSEFPASSITSSQLDPSPYVLKEPLRIAISRNRNVQLLQGVFGGSTVLIPASEVVVFC